MSRIASCLAVGVVAVLTVFARPSVSQFFPA
jgi:hypothetical protein